MTDLNGTSSLPDLISSLLASLPSENSTISSTFLNETESSPSPTDSSLVILYDISASLQVISLLASLILPTAYLLAQRYSKDLVRSIGFQLTVLLSISEAIGSSFQLYGNRVFSITPPTPVEKLGCQTLIAVDLFCSLWSASLALLIGYNLLRVFVYNDKRKGSLLLPLYLILSVSFSAAFTFVPLFLNVYSWDESQGSCWYTPAILSLLFYAPILLCIVLSCIVTMRVIKKLRSTQQGNPYFYSIEIASKASGENPFRGSAKANSVLFAEFQQRQAYKTIDKLVNRLLWYPIIPLLSQFPLFLSDLTFMSTGTRPIYLVFLAEITSSVEGILVCAVFFLLDPCWNKLYRDIRSDMLFPLSPLSSAVSRKAVKRVPKLTLQIASGETTNFRRA
jgi:hypothetical protein